MSLETLLTLLVAAALLGVAIALRLLVLVAVRSIRWVRGESPSQSRRFAEQVARKSWFERIKPLFQGAGALVFFTIASLVSGLRRVGVWIAGWWRDAARPSLEEAQTIGFALLTVEPDASRDVAVLERVASSLDRDGVAPKRREPADIQLV